ncbi:MAG: hypothetical protein WBB82_04495 [Limnothrix sp.]
MALTISNLIAHAPELHDSTQKEDPETTAADQTEPSPAAMPTEMEMDDESTLEKEVEVGDRPVSPLTEQKIESVQLVTIPQKKLIPNLETTFGVISFLAILVTPIILFSIARRK